MRKLGLMLAAFVLASLPVATPVQAAPVRGAPAAEPCSGGSIVKTATPFGTTACAGARPGGLVGFKVSANESNFCTLGFVYQDKYKQSYITTAGHCVVPEGKYKLWAPGKGPVAYVGGKAIGRAVYARNDPSAGYVYDIAMIQISKGVKVSSQVCHFGGPVGTTTNAPRGEQVEVYGNAQGLSAVLPARSLISTGPTDKYDTWLVGPSLFGDSGAPVLSASTGKAVGFITAIGYDLRTPTSPGVDMLVKRLGPQMYAVSKALHKTFYLKTAKRL